MKMCIQKFLNDRNYAVNVTLFVTTVAVGLLSLFLVSKVVSEIIVWSESDDTYAANTISVQGEGEVVSVPDVATFSFGVSVTSESVESAQSESAKSMNAALEYLKENSIDEKDVKTTNYYISPKYEYPDCRSYDCPPQEPKIIGYTVSQDVTVKVRETAKSGEILTGIGSKGVTNVSGLNFTIDDEDALQEEARTMAVKDARDKAEKLAKDLGVKLKKVVSFSEENNYYPMMDSYNAKGGAMEASQAIAPNLPVGENTVSSRVYVTYEIK